MLWNWYTTDACFISSTWQVTSHGMFAGSCIGVIALVVALEFLHRLGREYDQYLIYQLRVQQTRQSKDNAQEQNETERNPGELGGSAIGQKDIFLASTSPGYDGLVRTSMRRSTVRPRIQQQIVRALIHMLQFAVAYFIMLLAMYYNGYIIICILIGAFLGFAIFSGERLGSTG